MIKTIVLTGTEQEVQFGGNHTYYWVQNLGGGDVLVGLEPELADGKDDVLIVPSGGTGYVRCNDFGAKTVYLAGSGKVQVYGTVNAFCPFKPAQKGGDEITSSGGEITATGTVDYPIVSLNLYGKSTQDGTPTPDAPIDIASVSDDGKLVVTVDNGSDIMLSAEITSGLPLCSVGDVRDELVYNADGTGKIIKRTHKWIITSDIEHSRSDLSTDDRLCVFVRPNINGQPGIKQETNAANILCDKLKPLMYTDSSEPYIIGNNGESINYAVPTSVVSSVDELKTWLASNPLTVIYMLEKPYKIALSAAEITALMKLQTFDGVTNIYNDENAEMSVKVATNPLLAEYVKPVIDGIIARYEARIAALEAAIISNT